MQETTEQVGQVGLKGIGERLAALRAIADVGRRELRDLAELSRAYPGQIETGCKWNIGADVATRIAVVFGVSLDWFVNGTTSPPDHAIVRQAVERARARFEQKSASPWRRSIA